MPSPQGNWPSESSTSVSCCHSWPSHKSRSQVGRWGASDTCNAAWRPQKMTASRCMNRRIHLFGLCTTADGEINAGWWARGDLSGFHNAVFIFHWDFSLRADLPMTPGAVSTPLGPSRKWSALVSDWGPQFCSRRGCLSVHTPSCWQSVYPDLATEEQSFLMGVWGGWLQKGFVFWGFIFLAFKINMKIF